MQDTKPWYRQLWPWLLMVPPLGAVAGGIATIYLAVVSADGLVSQEYYKDGLAVNRILEKDLRAQELGLSAQARFNLDDGRVQILLPQKLDGAERLHLELLHPTRDRFDQRIEIASADGVQFLGQIDHLPPGLWYLRLEPLDAEWRLTGRLRLPGELQSSLLPARL